MLRKVRRPDVYLVYSKDKGSFTPLIQRQKLYHDILEKLKQALVLTSPEYGSYRYSQEEPHLSSIIKELGAIISLENFWKQQDSWDTTRSSISSTSTTNSELEHATLDALTSSQNYFFTPQQLQTLGFPLLCGPSPTPSSTKKS